MESVAELTRTLVSIPSHESEAAAGDRIEAWLRESTDAEVTRDAAGVRSGTADGREDGHTEAGVDSDDSAGRGGNVIARKGSGATALALVGHHDVVPPDESQTRDGAYVVAERDGRLYGRGSADMKGALAAAMCAFRDADPPDGAELWFASFVGEEAGGVGARAAIDGGFAPDYAVVCEGSTGYSAPGVTDVAVAHKGRRGSTVVAEGRAAHASEPGAGTNAVYRASDAVDVVRDIEFPEVAVMGRAVRGSVAVTEIEGGSAWNVIPDRCAVTVDERTVPGERAPVERVEEIEGVSLTVDQDLPPMRCDDPALADAVLEAARRARDGPGPTEAVTAPAHVVKPHATDAGWLADAGTTCVVCGPAERGEAHTADESVSLAVLDRCYEIYRSVAGTWSG